MGDPDAGVPTYTSIDPEALSGVSGKLKSTSTGIADHVTPLRSRFNEFGVSTTNLGKLEGFAATIDEVVPELERRHGLAVHMLADNPSFDGILRVQGDDIAGDFNTTAEAQEQAQQDAEAIKEDGLSGDALDNLQLYAGDPDYAEALIEELGREKFNELLYGSAPRLGEGPTPEALALSRLLATNSFRHPIDEEFVGGLQTDHEYVLPLQLLAKYAQYGGFSEESLTFLADAILRPSGAVYESPDGLQWSPTRLSSTDEAAILKALELDPRIAATYFADNRSWILTDADAAPDGFDGSAWAGFIRSATVDARNEFAIEYLDHPGDNPAIQNAQWLMETLGGEDRDHFSFSSEVRVAMANIAVEYLDDYAYTLGSPIDVGSVDDPGHDGVSVSTEQWQNFLYQGMADNDGMLLIAAGMQTKIDEITDRANRDEAMSPDDNALAVFWDDYTVGAMQDTFVNLYDQVVQDRDLSEQEQEDFWNNVFDHAIDYAFDPKGIIKDVSKEALKGLVHLGTEAAFQSEPVPAMPTGFDTKLNFADEAVGRLTLDEPFPEYDDGSVTWDGDPEFYQEPSPPNGDFLQYIDGGEMDYEAIRNDPAAWSSYNNWLHDPAVQAAIADGYANQLIGSHDN